MSDARALLRAHRAENRIKHPHAAYSDAGKLLCKLCHEPVKSESLWESHIRSPNHKKRLQTLQQQSTAPSQPTSTLATSDESEVHNKRKHDDVDESMSDAEGEDTDLIRKKRSKTEVAGGGGGGSGSGNDEKRQTPPALGRRTSGTPIQGIEIAIPSRPATPAAGSNSATSTPKNVPVGRSPLIGPESTHAPALPISTESLAVHQGPAITIPTSNPASTSATTTTTATQAHTHAHTHTQKHPTTSVDEAEWAAFEAEMAEAEAEADREPAGAGGDGYAMASISAPALTAAQVATKSQEEENERRKHLLEAEMADEREDATRALETEFEEMEELEGRVRRLKERREQLRRGSGGEATTTAKGADAGKENAEVREDEEENDDDDDDEEEEDDWDAFRFRA